VVELHVLQVPEVQEVQVSFAQAEPTEHVDLAQVELVDLAGVPEHAAAPVIAITKKTNIKMLTALIIVFCIIFSSNFLVCVNSKINLLLNGS
jgi:hypothetical protein